MPSRVFPGLVEVFTKSEASGWIEVPPEQGPVRVLLRVDEMPVASTWATDPCNRNVQGQARPFHFNLSDVWKFTSKKSAVTVGVDGGLLPIAGIGMALVPRKAGPYTLAQLQEKLNAGYVFNQKGRLQLSKTVDTEWQKTVLALYSRLSSAVQEILGYRIFACYGTLLGAVREGSFIGHDHDFDVAYISKHRTGERAREELQALAFALIDRGFGVLCRKTCIWVSDALSGKVKIDVFHLYFDENDELGFPFGVASKGVLRSSDVTGFAELPFAGSTVLAPAPPEVFVGHIYGDSWRTPNPGFNWTRNRLNRSRSGILTEIQINEVYWADFYARTTFDTGSTFSSYIISQRDLPTNVIDIGCGDGRDSFAFAAAGRRVLGVDRSVVGIKHASKKAASMGLDGLIEFHSCDVADSDNFRQLIHQFRTRVNDAPVVFYCRFFLHAITEEVQQTMMAAIGDCAAHGDFFVAEFRSDGDETIKKVHDNHYRRFQNGKVFAQSLESKFGFDTVVWQEGNGFSPYKGEDPILFRIVSARRK